MHGRWSWVWVGYIGYIAYILLRPTAQLHIYIYIYITFLHLYPLCVCVSVCVIVKPSMHMFDIEFDHIVKDVIKCALEWTLCVDVVPSVTWTAGPGVGLEVTGGTDGVLSVYGVRSPGKCWTQHAAFYTLRNVSDARMGGKRACSPIILIGTLHTFSGLVDWWLVSRCISVLRVGLFRIVLFSPTHVSYDFLLQCSVGNYCLAHSAAPTHQEARLRLRTRVSWMPMIAGGERIRGWVEGL